MQSDTSLLRRDVRPEAEADNRVVAEGEDGYVGTTGLPVGLHMPSLKNHGHAGDVYEDLAQAACKND